MTGAAAWCWTQAALPRVTESADAPADRRRRPRDVAAAAARAAGARPARAFPTASRALQPHPAAAAYAARRASACSRWLGRCGWLARRRVAALAGRLAARARAAKPRRDARSSAAGCRQRTWALPGDLRRAVGRPGRSPGAPTSGSSGGAPARMLAAEREVQPMVIAPPRAGKSSGYVVPWLLDHDGPTLVLSTKRDIYDASAAHRRRLGTCWVYDPFGERATAPAFTPLVPGGTAGRARSAPARRSPPPRTPTRRTPPTSSGTRRPRACSRRCCTPRRSRRLGSGGSIGWLDARDFSEAARRC